MCDIYPGCLLMMTPVTSAFATSDYLCFSTSVTLVLESYKDFCSGSIVLGYLLHLETGPHSVFIICFLHSTLNQSQC